MNHLILGAGGRGELCVNDTLYISSFNLHFN